MAKIDVVMPVKDGPGPLTAAISSMLWQTERDIRVIIVNDDSGPETVAIMERFANEDSRVTLIAARGKGIVDALNTGFDHATASYVARMDGDDIAFPTRFEAQLAVMEAQPRVALCGTPVIRFGRENGLSKLPTSATDCRRALGVFNCFYHPTVMIRRSILEEHHIRYVREYEYAEDYKLFCDLAAVGDAINLAEPQLLYRVHIGQISTTKRKAQELAALKVVAHQAGLGDRTGTLHDLRSLSAMAYAARQLGGTHAHRSLNAIKNGVAAVRFGLSRP